MTCSKFDFYSKPSFYGLSLSQVFRQLHIDYSAVYDDGFLRSSVYNSIIEAPFVKLNQDKLLTQIQKVDYKKKFNDLYKFN